MKTRSRVGLVTALALVICGSGIERIQADVALDPKRALLLRYDEHLDYEGALHTQWLVYRDGTVIVSTVRFGLVTYGRGQASPAGMALLNQFLSSSRIGVIEADGCVTVDPYPTGASYDNVLVWFGRHGRQNRLTFSTDGRPACSAEVGVVVLALLGFSDSVTFVDIATTAEP